MPRIVETRKQELEGLIIERTRDGCFLSMRELWLTAYGFDVLSTTKDGVFLRMPSHFRTVSNQFEVVKQAFDDMDMKLTFGEIPASITKLGEPLKNAIWWIIENEHKSWKEIEPIDSQSFNVYNLDEE